MEGSKDLTTKLEPSKKQELDPSARGTRGERDEGRSFGTTGVLASFGDRGELRLNIGEESVQRKP